MVIEEKEWQPLRKKHNWNQRQGGLSFDLVIRDETGRKIDRFFWNTLRRFMEILELLRLKYGMNYK